MPSVKIYDPNFVPVKTLYSTPEGGTGATTLEQAALNLNILRTSDIGVSQGKVPLLDSQGRLPAILTQSIVVGSQQNLGINGPLNVYVNTTENEFIITDYDNRDTYNISVNSGSVSRDSETILYDAPSSPGQAILTVNGKTYTITIDNTTVMAPSVLTPSNGFNQQGSSVSFTSSPFSIYSGSDTHLGTDWQVSTASNFSSLIGSVTNSSVNKTTYSLTGLLPATTYYARVRYNGSSSGYSQWSNAISFSTKSSFIPTVETAKLVASDASVSDYFGNSVAMSADGNMVIVGAYGDDHSGGATAGSAYILIRSGPTWIHQAKLVASDAASDDYFGHSVAMSADGNMIIVGGPYDDHAGGAAAGAAYIFTYTGSAWVQQAKLMASDAADNDQFGMSVAMSSDGNTVIVGARYDDHAGGEDAGSAYIFTRSGFTWTQQAKLVASGANANECFGQSVAISSDGNTVIVGASGLIVSGGMTAGAAYIFTRSGSAWTQQAKLVAHVTNLYEGFGGSVAMSSDGNTAIVGEPYSDNVNGSSAGAAYIFTRSGSAWTQQAKLVASDAGDNDRFGHSVAMSSDGNTVIVGAHYDDQTASWTAEGSACIFTRSGSTWTQRTKLMASDADVIDFFGTSVAMSADGNAAIVGSPNDSNAGGSAAGSAYIFS